MTRRIPYDKIATAFTVALSSFVVSFYACTTETTPNEAPSAPVQCSIANESFVCQTPTVLPPSADNPGIFFEAKGSNGWKLTLNCFAEGKTLVKGTFNFDSHNASLINLEYRSVTNNDAREVFTSSLAGGHGTITITEVTSNTFKATFTAELGNLYKPEMKLVKNGTLNLKW